MESFEEQLISIVGHKFNSKMLTLLGKSLSLKHSDVAPFIMYELEREHKMQVINGFIFF